MFTAKQYPLLLGLIVLIAFARPTLAFGAGNIASISKVEGQNWRHGDIEDTLLALFMARVAGGKKFDRMAVARVYFGNWLRDYSQAIDVGTVKAVSAEAIRLLLCVLGFMSFGYGSREFEVTADRLGVYRPEDHIDNPKNYADNVDARRYDPRLRGPVDERVELAVDRDTGMKNYIANERAGIMTSALHVRRLFGPCIELGRSYHRSKNKAELHEALRLMGTGLHCLEDFLAHSNYTELALIEMGERDVFPHVGRDTLVAVRGVRHEVYPCITGTFGGVDFLFSVTGELSDRLSQNEIQELEGTLINSQNQDFSFLRSLLDKIPSHLFGGGDKKQEMDEMQNNANAAQLQNMSVSPRQPEEFTEWILQVYEQVMPVIRFHDEILQAVAEMIEKIPVLPELIEQLEEQLSIFVFSVIAPLVVPVINQVKNELATGSSEIIQSSKEQQFDVFDDDRCSDPTHSMLSKDHFSNILNEIAGRTASKVVAWVVPQLMEAWDNHEVDIDRTLNRIVHGVLHHPAQRSMGEDGSNDCRSLMFRSVEEWWGGMDEGQREEYRRKLSRHGVRNGENLKEGVHDTGHGCCKPLGMHKNFAGGSVGGNLAETAASAIVGGVTGGLTDFIENRTGIRLPVPHQQHHDGPSASGGGGGGGGGLGGVLGVVADNFLGGFKPAERDTYQAGGRDGTEGEFRQRTAQNGYSGDRYGQAEFAEPQLPDGSERVEYPRYEQTEAPAPSYHHEEHHGGHHGHHRHHEHHHHREEDGVETVYDEQTEARPTGYGDELEGRVDRRWEERRW